MDWIAAVAEVQELEEGGRFHVDAAAAEAVDGVEELDEPDHVVPAHWIDEVEELDEPELGEAGHVEGSVEEQEEHFASDLKILHH